MNSKNGSKLKNQPLAITSTPVPPQLTDRNTGEQEVYPKSNSTGNSQFDQPVILRQSDNWSRAVLWTIMGVTTFGVIWASVAKIDEAVPAQGKLEPQGAVKEVQAPISGVVKEIFVKDGQLVKQGDLLLRLDPTAAKAQLASLNTIRTALIKENQFYRSVIGKSDSSTVPQLPIPQEIASLAESRKALIAENRLYRTQLVGDTQGTNLSLEQRARLRVATRELNSRVAANELEVEQLKKQLAQNTVQLTNAKSRFAVEQGIRNRLQSLAQEGGIGKIQYLKQEQEVKTRQAEIDQLIQEEGRLQLKIGQAQQQLANTTDISNKELTDKIAENEKRLAEIDSQLNKAIVENEKKLAETDSQLSQTKVNLAYQEVRAPVAGTVFDLKPSSPGFVTNTTEPVVKIVPGDSLVAKVYITNKDIGFVKEGMPVDVRIDSFPFSEFGDIKGKLTWIGSDALPPEQIRPYYTFPATVTLNRQVLVVNDRKIPLQSGMSISTNIKVRDRSVMSIFTDLFSRKTESLKNVR